MPAEWRRGDSMPMYVGALAKGWLHGRVESKLIRGGRNEDVVGTVEIPGGERSRATIRAPRQNWTHDELLVALNLYHKLTFGQLHARQPAIIALAEKLGRPANSVAMKLSNFASLDPALKLRGIKGLVGASTLDRTIWNEFHADLNETVPASEQALRNLFGADESSELEVLPKEGVRLRETPAERSDGSDGKHEAASRTGITFAMRSSTTAGASVRSPGSPCGSCSLRRTFCLGAVTPSTGSTSATGSASRDCTTRPSTAASSPSTTLSGC